MNDNKAFGLPAAADRRTKPLRPDLLLWLAVTAALALVVFALAFMSSRSMDDYYYAAFWNDGFSAYFDKFAAHYQNMNGRTLVHVVATVVLHGGAILFALVSVGLAVVIPLLGHRLVSPNASPLPALAAFMAGLLLAPRLIAVHGLLWQSAYFNYVFPTAMTVSLLYLLRRAVHRQRLNPAIAAGVIAYAFLCGATTEQSGLLAVCTVLAVSVECLVVARKRAWLPLACLLTAAAGVSTVFLSPATQARIRKENGGPFWPHVCRGLTSQIRLLQENPSILVLLAVLFLLLSLFYAARWDGAAPSVLLFLLPLPPLLGVGLVDKELCLPFYCALLLFMVGAGVFFWLKGERSLGVLLALSVGSLLVIASTNSSGPRTVTPFYLYLLTVLSCCLSALCAEKWKSLGHVGTAILVVAGVVCIGFHMPHYVYNYTVERHNRAAEREAHSTNILWYDISYDMDYTYQGKPYSSPFCRQHYLPSVGLSDDTCQIYFYDSSLPKVFLKDRQLELPALPDENGDLLLPMRLIIEGLGGTVEWMSEKTVIRLDGRETTLIPVGSILRLSGTDDRGEPCTIEVPYNTSYYATVLPPEVYERLFSLHITYGEKQIVITR